MSRKSLTRCISVEEVRELARRRNPAPIFDLFDSGREDSIAFQRNIDDLRRLRLMPRVLRDVDAVDTRVRVLGCDLSFPLILSPTGGQSLLDPANELAGARAAAKAGIMYGLSSFGTEPLERVAEAGAGPRMFQLNAYMDEDYNLELIERAKRARYDVLCLTVDNPVSPRQDRYDRWGLQFTGALPLKTTLEFARKPGWVWRHRDIRQRAMPYSIREMLKRGGSAGTDIVAAAFRRDLTWQGAERYRKLWNGPFALKGILNVEDARMAVEIGASAVIVCNHGGLALDSAPSSISVLEEIANAVGSELEVLLGSGIRRGSSMVKAIALGAKAVLAGRAFLYGLGAGGEAGVSHVIELLRAEFETTLRLCGCTAPDQLERSLVRS